MNTDSREASPQRHSFISRGLTLSYLDSHPDDLTRPVVLLLHGFPDTSDMWSTLIALLSAKGYRCIAPDTLGCGHSDLSQKEADYNVLKVITDHVALLDHLAVSRVHLVGHDWGAAAAWLLAAYYPERICTLAAMSVGHPASYARGGLRQMFASWYIVYFKCSRLSERFLAGQGRFSLQRVFGCHPDIGEVIDRLKHPGRLTAALQLYRASLPGVLTKQHPKVVVPTLGVWSKGDIFCLEKQMTHSTGWVDNEWHYESRPGGHWIPLEEPKWLVQRLEAHFAR